MAFEPSAAVASVFSVLQALRISLPPGLTLSPWDASPALLLPESPLDPQVQATSQGLLSTVFLHPALSTLLASGPGWASWLTLRQRTGLSGFPLCPQTGAQELFTGQRVIS